MAHSVSGDVLYVSMWFNTKFVRVPNFCFEGYIRHFPACFSKEAFIKN